MTCHCEEPKATKQSDRRDSSPFGLRMTATFFSLLILTASAFAVSSPQFTDANTKYQAGDFKAASALYEQALKSGHRTAAVHFNLGNAMLRQGEKGQALLHYLRAYETTPRDRDLLWNIQVLKGALADRIEDKTSNPFLTPLEKVRDLVSMDEVALALSLSLALLALLALVDYFFAGLRAVTGFFRTLAFLAVFTAAVLFGFKWMDAKDPHAVVLDKETTAYYGPSDRETKAFLLHEGAEGKVLDSSGDWVYLSLKNHNTGWIRRNSCELV